MSNGVPTAADGGEIQRMLAENAIRKMLYRYCRGIDRRDFDLVRSCYHPDATDDHGPFSGGVDEFIEWCRGVLADFDATMHFIGNVLIEFDDDDPHVAYSEAYAVTYHRIPERGERPARDYVVATRYVDRFERRDDVWAVAERRCALDWSRMDVVGPCPPFGPGSTLGIAGPEDVVYAPR